MFHTLAAQLVVLTAIAARAGDGVRARTRPRPHQDAGISTLEAIILILGGITIASLLVAALTQFVQTNVAKIR